MAGNLSEKCRVGFSNDNMSATLFLEPPSDGIAYSVDELAAFVKNKGVYGGIIYSALEEMTTNNIYYTEHVIAKGRLPEEGNEGYYELFFDANGRKKPAVRSDGSVDYQSMSDIPMVSAGDKLIHYHPAVQGVQGYDVRGRALRAKPCKDLPVIKGSGFRYNENEGIYYAASEGKIEYDGKTLRVTDVYELKGDLDLVAGKIDFRGDVIIKGNVKAGTLVRATKSITVEGSVESATLISGGDIVLKKGIQGGKKARISCGGDLYANFIEFTEVEAKGKVEANIIMNCHIRAGKDVLISGKRGALVGGSAYAVGFLNTNFLGNVAGHKTTAAVGITDELRERERVLETKLSMAKKSIENTNASIMKLTDPRLSKFSKDTKEVREAKVSQFKRRLNRDERLAQHIEEELKEITQTMGVGKRAKITIDGTAFVGSTIVVDDLSLVLERQYLHSEFSLNEVDGTIAIVEK